MSEKDGEKLKGLIRWKPEDIKNLRTEINRFNNKVRRLEKNNKSLFIPEKLNFKQEQQKILTRKGLYEFLDRTSRFSKRNAEKLIELESR